MTKNLYDVPTIEVESASGVREVSLSTRHLSNRKIFLNGVALKMWIFVGHSAIITNNIYPLIWA